MDNIGPPDQRHADSIRHCDRLCGPFVPPHLLIERFSQRFPLPQPMQRGVSRQREFRHAKIGDVGVLGHLKRFVGRTEISRLLPRQFHDARHRVWQRNMRRQMGRMISPHPADHRTVTRKTVGMIGENQSVGLKRRMARQRFDCRAVMIVHPVMQAPYDCQPIRHLRQSGQMLANADPRHPSRNLVKLAAHLRRSVRLHVKRIVMARPARLKQQDARFDRRQRGCRFLAPRQTSQRQAQ
jgi:hypothetical protein